MTEALATPAGVAENAPGWSSLITAARRLSVIHGVLTVPRHDINGGLLFDVNATGADEDDRERVLGILAAIHAASTEICAACAAPTAGRPATWSAPGRPGAGSEIPRIDEPRGRLSSRISSASRISRS